MTIKLSRAHLRADFEFNRLKYRKFISYQKFLGGRPPSKAHIIHKTRLIDEFTVNTEERTLILCDSFNKSPGGYSALLNFSRGLSSVSAPVLLTTTLTPELISNFNPSVVLLSNVAHQLHVLSSIEKSLSSSCLVGLSFVSGADDTNYVHEVELEKFLHHKIDFLWGFKNSSFYKEYPDCKRFVEATGAPVIPMPFGADISQYYPLFVDRKTAAVDFIFLASRNLDKWKIVKPILGEIKKMCEGGYINGPGWVSKKNILSRQEHLAVFDNVKFGLNLHVPSSSKLNCELNERFYNLSLTGLPQVVDHIDFIDELGFSDKVFTFNNPGELSESIEMCLSSGEAAMNKSYEAYLHVMEGHTNIHRASKFISDITALRTF